MSTRRETAAGLLAADDLSDEQIAARTGVSRQSLQRWKRQPEFQVRLHELREAHRQAILDLGIAEKRNRVAALNDRWERMQQVIRERAEDPEMQRIPGGTTGLLVKQTKQIGGGRHAQTIEEYAVDTGLLAELRATETAAAKELDQLDSSDRAAPGAFGIQIVAIDYRQAIAALAPAEIAPRPVDYRLAPGQGESPGDGETVG